MDDFESGDVIFSLQLCGSTLGMSHTEIGYFDSFCSCSLF